MLNSKYKGLLRNISHLTIMQVFNFLAPLLVLPYLTLTLGVESFGRYAIYLSIIQMCYVITDFGFNLSATHKVAVLQESGNKNAIKALIGNITVIKLFLNTIIFLILTLFFGLSTITLLLMLNIISQSFIFTWLFQGLEKMKWIMISTIIIRSLYIFFVFLLVDTEDDIQRAVFCFGFANLIAAVFSFIIIQRLGFGINVSNLQGIINEVKESFHFFLSRVAVAFYTSSSVFVLGLFVGNSAAGIYSVCEQLYKAAQAGLSPISQVLFPYMTKKRDWKLFHLIVFSVGGVLLICASPFIIYADELIQLVFGSEYKKAGSIFPVFVFTAIINFFGVCFGYPALAAVNRVRFANLSVILGALTHIGIISFLYFSGEFSPINLALSVLATEVIVFALRLFVVVKTKRTIQNLYKRAV